jgi:hypothetical protein
MCEILTWNRYVGNEVLTHLLCYLPHLRARQLSIRKTRGTVICPGFTQGFRSRAASSLTSSLDIAAGIGDDANVTSKLDTHLDRPGR